MKYYSKKTVIVTKNGKTTETIEETSTDNPPEEPKVFKKFNKLMSDFSKLMDKL